MTKKNNPDKTTDTTLPAAGTTGATKPGPATRPQPLTARLPGAGVRRDLKETWGNIKAKNEGEQAESGNAEARLVKTARISPTPNQPRRTFDAGRDEELAADIKERGILEPIIVRPDGTDDEGPLYQIVAGERRYRAALSAGLGRVPVIVKNYTDKEARFTSLVENIQRLDLDPLDEAYFFQTLNSEFDLSYREISRMINRSIGYISERINRLKNPNPAVPKTATSQTGSEANIPEEGTNKTTDISEKNHNSSYYEQKLQNSQMDNPVLRPVFRFREYLDRTRLKLAKLKNEERELLSAEIKELKEYLADLEKEFANPNVPRETSSKKGD